MEMIGTIHGDLPVDSLMKRVDVQDQPDGIVTATEYWQLVRRDVAVELKPHAVMALEAQEL